VYSYNRFVTQRASLDASWAGIDVELQRRHDLVPNLVETVRGYADHEQRTLTAVTEARARAVAAVAPRCRSATRPAPRTRSPRG
jgi:LemA protein